MPLPAADLTATAVVDSANRQSATGSVTETSSRAASTSLFDPQSLVGTASTPAPVSTLAALGTISLTPAAGTPTPSASRTPAPLATGTAATTTATPVRTATPAATGSATPAVGISVTPTVAAGAQLTQLVLTPSPTLAPAATGDRASEALTALNDYRTKSGRPALRSNPQLAAAAAGYARLMGQTNYFGHTGPDGSVAEGRIAAAGYRGMFKGEALAAGQPSASSVITNWLGSPAHAGIILDVNSAEVGIGYYNAPGTTYVHYWVLVTGNP